MKQDDYLSDEAYENQSAHPTKTGFTGFFDEESQSHFFGLLDENGKVLLKSEGYKSESSRDNGIDSVIKNRGNSELYSVKEDGGEYFLSLRAKNNQEIGRSVAFKTEAEALELATVLSGGKTVEMRSAKETAELDQGEISDPDEMPTKVRIGKFSEDSPTEKKTEQYDPEMASPDRQTGAEKQWWRRRRGFDLAQGAESSF